MTEEARPGGPRVMHIAAGLLAVMDRHARTDAPAECCGLLVGTETLVQDAIPTRNIAPRPTRYEIDPADYFHIMREARAEGLRILGAYHSHPHSDPIPSPTDLADAFPGFLYVIVRPWSTRVGSETRAWCLEAGNFHEVRLVLVA